MSDNINGTRFICDTCKVKLTRSLPNKIQMWHRLFPPTTRQALSAIKSIVGILDPYGFGTQGFHYHEMVESLKIYVLFRRIHKDHRIHILHAGQVWPKGTENYRTEPQPTGSQVKSSWNKLGEWVGGTI